MENFTAQQPTEADHVYNTSVFGGFKRIIQSKNFQGGAVTLVFGEVELDMSFADITSPAVIDITQLFGAIKLYVPTGWKVIHETTHIVSGVKDKRLPMDVPDTNEKVLILRGISILGEVKVIPSRFANI
jgi:predicted membrane protein